MLELRPILLAVTVLAMALFVSDGERATADHQTGHVCVTEITIVTTGSSIQERVCAQSAPEPEEPATVRVWLVDFKGAPAEGPGNYQVIRDREDLDPQKIDEYADACGATDAIEWKDCIPAWPDGAREKDWPVSRVKKVRHFLA